VFGDANQFYTSGTSTFTPVIASPTALTDVFKSDDGSMSIGGTSGDTFTNKLTYYSIPPATPTQQT
jgi:hypothetical protein